MRFSLLCPTRNRVAGCERLIKSLKETCNNLGEVEILFAVDDDDKESDLMLNKFKTFYTPVQIKVYKRKQSEFINGDYYNWLAKFSIGEFLQVIGDDCVMLNPGWDHHAYIKIREYLEDKPDGIVYGMVEDGTPPPAGQPKQFCCFPLVSRRAYEMIGHVLHGEIPTWGADTTLYEVYSDKRVNRVMKLQEITIRHISHHTGDVARDSVSHNVERIYKKYCSAQIMGRVRRMIVPQDINALETYIKGFAARKDGVLERVV
jgi:hypothetical protein